ncbi:MAG: hypothetical protein AB7Q17_04935 [Phycisphaerae bacterium]
MRPRLLVAAAARAACVCVAMLVALFAIPALAASESLSHDAQREILQKALAAFDQAVNVARRDESQAERLYRDAAAGFESLAAAGVRNAALEYNLGNTFFRLNDLGRAILHYRRAARLAAPAADLVANLEYARARVTPQFAPSGESRLFRQLFAWHVQTSRMSRLQAAGIAALIGSAALLLRLRWRNPALAWVAGGALAVAGLAAGSLVVQLRDEAAAPPAVVIRADTTLRLGRGEGYDPALAAPLGAGVELRIINERGDWLEIRLPTGVTGWLPAAAVERV